MPSIVRRKKTEEIPTEEETVQSILQDSKPVFAPIETTNVISTGSTLLDLAISGGRVRGGGIPGGIMVELYGPSSSGKTSLLVEIGASIQNKGGTVFIADPEARLDQEYTAQHGLKIPADHYTRPDTVNELFEMIQNWEPVNPNAINLFGADSIAALSSDLEMGEGGDKRGQKKAKDLSEGCRKTARIIAKKNKLVVFTNQERQSEFGKTTPGGFAVGYHSSLRIRIARQGRIEQEKTIPDSKKKVKKTIGLESEALIIKSSVDDEYRKAPLYIVFGFGIDDVRANLQWLKDSMGETTYDAMGMRDKGFSRLEAAIKNVEDNNLEGALRDKVIDLWEKIEATFKIDRKKKHRF